MKFNNICVICIAALVFLALSCSEMNDLHQPFLDKGEIIYAAKVDSVAPSAGKSRIQLELFLGSQRIETIRIYWNDYKDSVDIPIGNQTGTKIVMLENMEEKGYIFNLVSFDKFGNKSLPFEAIGKVYGDRFQATLTNRVVASKTPLADGKTTINWSGAVDNGLRCDLVYTNTLGEKVTVEVPMKDSKTVIFDFASDMSYRTLYLPEATAIDTFYTEYKRIDF